MDCQECKESYPLKLTFVCPFTKIEFTKVMNDDAQAEEVFHWFFSRWGYEIPYSVDSI